ncbi:MAG: hypothetical protein IJD48_01535 [Clostridia bacterium]|nr:hypothetical protein [Clostridia bacterium]
MEKVDEILGKFFNRKGKGKEENTELTQQEPKKPVYSMVDQAMATVLGVPVDMVANWKSFNETRFLHSGFDSGVISVIRGFHSISEDPEQLLKEAQAYAGRHLSVSKGQDGRVCIRCQSEREREGRNERTYSVLTVKPESSVNIQTGNEHLAYVCHYTDHVERYSKIRSGEYKVEHRLETAGRQLFMPTPEGRLYCTNLENYEQVAYLPGMLERGHAKSPEEECDFARQAAHQYGAKQWRLTTATVGPKELTDETDLNQYYVVYSHTTADGMSIEGGSVRHEKMDFERTHGLTQADIPLCGDAFYRLKEELANQNEGQGSDQGEGQGSDPA